MASNRTVEEAINPAMAIPASKVAIMHLRMAVATCLPAYWQRQISVLWGFAMCFPSSYTLLGANSISTLRLLLLAGT